MQHLKWGVLGTGFIARLFTEGLHTLDQAAALAIGSRNLEKAQTFARECKMERAYGSYDELLADKDVDAVYIALPNHMHAEWSIKSAEAGKHILCEKPVTVNAAELEKVLEVVKKNDVFFMEAFMYRCHPQWLKVLEIIAAGRIGQVRMLQSNFTADLFLWLGDQAHSNIRFQHKAAGGSLMDMGCYCVSFSRLIANEEPSEVHALGAIGEESRVDEWTAGVLKFPSGIIASFTCALRCLTSVPTQAIIFGSHGQITITKPWSAYDTDSALIVEAAGKKETIEMKDDRNPYGLEALTVAEYLDRRQALRPAMSWEDSLGQMRTLDALRADMGLIWDSEK